MRRIPVESIQLVTNMYRDQLTTMVRYERFMNGETVRKWEQLLGPDVIWLTHPAVVRQIADRFIRYSAVHGPHLSDTALTKLRTAALVHDWGELSVDNNGVGDVSYDQRTPDHTRKEEAIFRLIASRIPYPRQAIYIRNAYRDVVSDKDSLLGRIFTVVERIGYLETALRCCRGVGGEKVERWQELAGNVLSNQIPNLIAASYVYPYVSYVLHRHAAAIGGIFTKLSGQPVRPDNSGKASYDQQKFDTAYDGWKAYRKKGLYET